MIHIFEISGLRADIQIFGENRRFLFQYFSCVRKTKTLNKYFPKFPEGVRTRSRRVKAHAKAKRKEKTTNIKGIFFSRWE